MKKAIKILSVLLTIVTITALLSGCTNPFASKEEIITNDNYTISESSPADIAIVVGSHANSMSANLSDSFLNSELLNTIKAFNYNTISIICCDGEPYLVDQITIPEPETSLTKQQKTDNAIALRAEIIKMLGAVQPKTSEVNTLKAMELASRMLSSSNAESKRLYLFDTCLSTTGVVDFTSIPLRSNPEKVVEKINEVYKYTDLQLDGVDAVISGLGDVFKPQPALSSLEKSNLKSIWKGILKTAGAKSITMSQQVSTDGVSSELCPKVSIVEATAEKVDNDALKNQAIIFDDNSNIRFEPDKYTFVDEISAKKELEDIANIMKEDSELKIIIVGSTATYGTIQNCKKLSLQRADACKKVLVKDNGISAKRIRVLGAGQTKTKYRVNDLDKNGKLIETEARKNRCVIIINDSLPEAKQLARALS